MRKTATLMLAAGLAVGMALPTTVSAATYGPSGLGANLHRRHVMLSATKNAKSGKPVRRSAILWMAGPRSTAWRGR